MKWKELSFGKAIEEVKFYHTGQQIQNKKKKKNSIS